MMKDFKFNELVVFNMMKMKFVKFGFLVFLLTVSIEQQAQDYSQDKKLGAEAAVQVEQMIGIYQDSSLTAYLNAVGQRLVNVVDETPLEFNFYIADMVEPNAFALPGGYIYVSCGFLSLINDEAELACVLGHEMLHVIKRHSVKQQRKKIIPGILHIPGAIVGVFNSNLGRIINTPVSLGSELFLSNYSRRQENESDKLGIKLASEAGYDPHQLALMLARLSDAGELLTGEAETRSYFSSHPFTPKRVENIEKEIEKLSWTEKPALAPDKKSVYNLLEGMVYGQNPAQGIFEENVFKHADLNLHITFPVDWKTINIPVAVGVTQPDGEAQLAFMVDDSGSSDPDSLGKAFAEQLRKRYNMIPEKSESLDINGYPAYVVAITDNSGTQPVYIQIYWLKVGDIIFDVLGMSYLKHSQTISEAVISVRPLTEDERQNITYLKVEFSNVEEGESIDTFSERTENKWDDKNTVLKNGLKNNQELKEKQLLKIAVKENYSTK